MSTLFQYPSGRYGSEKCGTIHFGIRLSLPSEYGDEQHLPMIVMNGLLGGFAHSKLFTNVRENAGLAYTISSQLDLFSGFLRMYAGINRGKSEPGS